MKITRLVRTISSRRWTFLAIACFGGLWGHLLLSAGPSDEAAKRFSGVRFAGGSHTLVFRFCPDGRQEACAVATYDTRTGRGRRFVPENRGSSWSWPAVSPDGKELVAIESRPGGDAIILLSLERLTYRRFQGATRTRYRPQFSGDGRTLLMAATVVGGDLDRDPEEKFYPFSIYRFDPATQEEELATPDAFLPRPRVLAGRFGFAYDNHLMRGGAVGATWPSAFFVWCDQPSCRQKPQETYIASRDPFFQAVANPIARLEGASDAGRLLFSLPDKSSRCGYHYNLFYREPGGPTERVTAFDCAYFSDDIDISPDGTRVFFRTAPRLPASPGYRRFAESRASPKELARIKADVRMGLIEIDGTGEQAVALPKRIEDYEPVTVRMDKSPTRPTGGPGRP